MPIVVSDALIIPDAELQWRFTRSGGPGGQHANKVATRAELTWSPADSAVLTEAQRSRLSARLGRTVTVAADDERSQTRNRELAAARLAERVRKALVVPRNRRPTKRTRGSEKRRLDGKRRAGETKRLRRRPSADD